ncbi:sarcosine oxidase/sarcosine oxidase subunit beta [Tistlia consotensis]|uniref:Sarcosine oxidase/sarcosine oxidase subunit beta n=1 Tax=Tistlia consotensis USBA 355 TaxID=560819 RepID=A0A1Y6B797_9PROT|nr:FAD-dependent oxidoreductase [Tistlia consotensis]SME94287.1 sarcosine oxidase/sarcosine oxidase subunit beta [Tistlia consotensis USBA 355]SNR29256.1 sarcosine oxidase/sarcosine oxidase subunit beta [Tistlia consotensis]
MKVAVVGAGAVGLSAAWALTRRGHEVLVLDQGAIPNPLGASFDEHRLIRPHYGALDGYAALVPAALEAWQRLWDTLGRRHLAPNGALALGLPGDGFAEASERSFRALGIPCERVEGPALAERFPYFRWQSGVWALYSPLGGVLFADRIVGGLADWLRGQGVALRPDSRVVALDAGTGRLELADGGREQADALVVAGGAWAGKLLPELAGQRPMRQIVAFVEPPARLAEAWRRAPALTHLASGPSAYCAPPLDGTRLKFGRGELRRPADPDGAAPLGADEPAAVFEPFRPLLADFDDYRLLGGKVCRYALSPDGERFLPLARDRLVAVAGCSGHMFKFAALMGERLAEAATGGLGGADFEAWARGEVPAAA